MERWGLIYHGITQRRFLNVPTAPKPQGCNCEQDKNATCDRCDGVYSVFDEKVSDAAEAAGGGK